ncbi:glucosidase [Pontibacter sp. SGAir0037]|uniref:MGH1-like glycoside hydrolase domain-containing protein n=1 Tax=Pontibacter sp. SGAir0037 TaxID=2571030 RepID=UPI0010CD6983|nr:glucosidase [Pontibacter sp. SGAir0037]QCR21046.1 glucosidase [Pontibacter sp. SGAir0037]
MVDFGAKQDNSLKPDDKKNFKKWGPYLTERQWGTVREDYSFDGDAWNCITHDKARSIAYRWGEEGIAGFCDDRQILCLAPAFWNGKDPILKERLFGLANEQGNHGEDVKEIYFHLDSSPTHSYTKYLYKYPQTAFPYNELIEKNRRGRDMPEYELLDTAAFTEKRYFDCYIEYAKADVDDILMKITVYNRGPEAAAIHVLPHLWFRNYWKHNPRFSSKRPQIASVADNCIKTSSSRSGEYYLYHEAGEQLFCENETNNQFIYHTQNDYPYVKDGINDYVLMGQPTVNPEKVGTKSAIWFKKEIAAGGSHVFRVRLSREPLKNAWADFDTIFAHRQSETDDYYGDLTPKTLSQEHKKLLRKAFGGLLWTKQFYYMDVYKWLNGEPGHTPADRIKKRNVDWQHLTNRHIISMPDKWEYPWYAAWDLAFHATSFVHVDPEFAKEQLQLMLKEYYMHPNGQIPAYEWNFSDVNPPVHAWAVWEVYEKDKIKTGKADYDFLERAFQKLLMNFTWWVNRKDENGNYLFEGGFLGLDNIGVFDRSKMPAGIKNMQQADSTSWMAMFSLNMLRISLELAGENPAYEESAAKFFRHFLNIAWAMHHIGDRNISLWDDEDDFFYDVVQFENGGSQRLKIRSLVGIIPLFAVEMISKTIFDYSYEFKVRAINIMRTRPDLASLISRFEKKNDNGDFMLSIMRGYRLEHLLKRLLDESEFLSDFGIRSLSKYHLEHPFEFDHHGKHVIQYEPGESSSYMFGGNSNWRGPIWFPLNYLIIQSLRKYYSYYGPSYVYEFPTGSGNKLNLKQIANELTIRLLRIFEKDETGKYRYHSDHAAFADDEHFAEHHLFYEFFNGDTGQGLGASHQTGWTALVANLLLEMDEDEYKSVFKANQQQVEVTL